MNSWVLEFGLGFGASLELGCWMLEFAVYWVLPPAWTDVNWPNEKALAAAGPIRGLAGSGGRAGER